MNISKREVVSKVVKQKIVDVEEEVKTAVYLVEMTQDDIDFLALVAGSVSSGGNSPYYHLVPYASHMVVTGDGNTIRRGKFSYTTNDDHAAIKVRNSE